MQILEIPFNRFVGLEKPENPEPGVLALGASGKYLNHIGTVHAAAQFALAEACSGEFLLSRFPEWTQDCVGVVRRAEVKYRMPAAGRLLAKARIREEGAAQALKDIRERGRAFLHVLVRVSDPADAETMTADFEWYVQRRA